MWGQNTVDGHEVGGAGNGDSPHETLGFIKREQQTPFNTDDLNPDEAVPA
jgi:hypothetical protein